VARIILKNTVVWCLIGDQLPRWTLILPSRSSNPGKPASHHGLSPFVSRTLRSADICGGWRPRARSLARKFGHLAPKAAKFGPSLCSVIFQYPKSGSGAVQRRLRFRGDRFHVITPPSLPGLPRRWVSEKLDLFLRVLSTGRAALLMIHLFGHSVLGSGSFA